MTAYAAKISADEAFYGAHPIVELRRAWEAVCDRDAQQQVPGKDGRDD